MSDGIAGIGTNTAGSVAALQGEIRRERTQLNDWVTCVSATTPKGKEEIQSLAAKISAAKSRIARIEATTSAPHGNSAGGRIDTWA